MALSSTRPVAWRRRRRWRRRARCSDDDEDDHDHDHDDHGSVRHGGGGGVCPDERTPAASVLQDPRGRPLETVVEMLRVRHGLTRESVERLNNMFGGQLALSLIALSVMVLFDIYNEAFHKNGTVSRSNFIYGWLLQYIFRFLVIVITAHSTTQEVMAARPVVATRSSLQKPLTVIYTCRGRHDVLQVVMTRRTHHSLSCASYRACAGRPGAA